MTKFELIKNLIVNSAKLSDEVVVAEELRDNVLLFRKIKSVGSDNSSPVIIFLEKENTE